MPCNRGCCATNREHWLSVGVAPSATPTRGHGIVAVETNAREARWQKDMPAYKRLREDGLQPKGIDGCAEVEAKASTVFEVEHNQVMTKAQLDQYASVMGEVA